VCPTDLKHVALEVIAGLRELHQLNIIHRDLKPQNVLQSQGRWKLCDFGTSKFLGQQNAALTFKRYGTPGYTAPEQWNGARADPSADIYSFGKLLVFLATTQTDIDHLFDSPAVLGIARRCTEVQPSRRATLEEIEKELTQL
jgi:serine/threonine protein kinase